MLSCMVHKAFSSWTSNLTKPYRISFMEMANMFNTRWAFKTSEWQPTEEEILAASTYIQNEEKQRISKFVFQDDAKSSLVGRLLLRKYVHMATTIPYEDIRFERDDHGKPYLQSAGDYSISFNVSHQGDYVVLAGNKDSNIGIDIMKVEPPVNKNISEFFRIMTRQFSPHEWITIKSFPTEMEQIACFYRIWCLKESYVKNTGFGITVPLDEISFSIKTSNLEVGKLVTDTVLYERNVLKKEWIFEETLLDEKHTIAVSVKNRVGVDNSSLLFDFLTFEELVREAKPIYNPDDDFSKTFMKKQMKNF